MIHYSDKTVAELDKEFERLHKKLEKGSLDKDEVKRLSQLNLERQLVIFEQLVVDLQLVKSKSKFLRNPKDAADLLKVKYEQYSRLRDNLEGFLEEVAATRQRGLELLKALADVSTRFQSGACLDHRDKEVFQKVLKY